ncbi:MAG TPA: CNP1-like family protein [Noviherbaspirillum sp.]
MCTVLLATSSVLHAQSQFEQDFDGQDKPWQEVAVQLPAAPKQENLLPFHVSATATQTFAIDSQSLSVGTDGVVRYTLVATSESGAKSVSYEGIRCASYEHKLYAFGRPDGSWSRSRRDQWERINTNIANRQHAALSKDYFCLGQSVVSNVAEMIQRIRAGKSLAQ